jgi:hypothetical protein
MKYPAVVILSNDGKGNEFLIPAACFCEKEFTEIKSNKQVERRILKERLACHPSKDTFITYVAHPINKGFVT